MTRHVQTRCQHCNVFYVYQASGHGSGEERASSKHCKGCNGAILDALSKIPKFLPFQRIFAGLFDTETGDSQNIREIKGREFPYSSYTFRVSTWKKSSEYEIGVKMEYDLVDDKWTGNLWR